MADTTHGALAPTYHPLPVTIARAHGTHVWDTDGNEFLDFLSGYSALNFGHLHQGLVAAAMTQLRQVTLTSRAFDHDRLEEFAQRLVEVVGPLTTGGEDSLVVPMNTGAEAVETAIKAVRKWGYEVKGVAHDQAEIVVASNNFHGRTLSIVSFSTDPDARDDFGPFTPGFRIIPFGDADALEAAITPNTVAFLVEPIQGEAGVIVPPAGYFTRVRELCTAHGVTLILDEIQTGLGRTGRLLAEEHEGIEADVTLIGKALGGGFYPVSAVLSNSDVLGVLKPGQHGSTFGGNPLACAVARAALRVLTEEHLIERSAELGAHFKAGLDAIRSNRVREVRGRGLMLAVELHAEAGPARPVVEVLRDRGILAKETHGQTIRLSPPLVIEKAEIDWALEQIEDVLRG